jgi:hypothetical protein
LVEIVYIRLALAYRLYVLPPVRTDSLKQSGREVHAGRACTLLHFRRASSVLCDSVMMDIRNQRRHEERQLAPPQPYISRLVAAL